MADRELYGLTFNEAVDEILREGLDDLDVVLNRVLYRIEKQGTFYGRLTDITRRMVRESALEYARARNAWIANLQYNVTEPSTGYSNPSGTMLP